MNELIENRDKAMTRIREIQKDLGELRTFLNEEVGQKADKGADYDAAEIAYTEAQAAESALDRAAEELSWIGGEGK